MFAKINFLRTNGNRSKMLFHSSFLKKKIMILSQYFLGIKSELGYKLILPKHSFWQN